ncbi:hypothetical protein [Kitasatospora sp. NPDC008115]|uniref:hypothetical protein n=1 Tax=Kitasatospora sp. NPDC008115 TaxID=3364022 RepID=UPI0036E37328
MTETLRTRAIRTALDTADSIAIVTAGAATGLTPYRTLTARPTEIRITLALATGTLAAVLTDHHAYKALTPLRRRLVAEHHTAVCEAVPAPTREQLAADVCADAAQRAASGAAILDFSHGALTEAENWTGQPDGSATCELPGGAHLLCVPSPATDHGYAGRSYLLVRGEEKPLEVRSISELTVLLDEPAADPAPPAGEQEEGDPWAALGRAHAIAELVDPAPDGDDQGDEGDDVDHEV